MHDILLLLSHIHTFLTVTVILKERNNSSILFSERVIGSWSTNAIIFALKVFCISVYLYSLFNTVFGCASFLRATTTLIPSLFDSSLISAIPVIFSLLLSLQFSLSCKLYLLDMEFL